MESIDFRTAFNRLKFGEDAFHELMQWRIRRILLVLPHYDAWILEHDAKLLDQIVGEYHQLNLTTVPRLTTVSDDEEALAQIKKHSFDLMILGMRVGNSSPSELAREAKKMRPNLSVLMLLSSRSDLAAVEAGSVETDIDASFLWTGDSRLLLAMIKYVEDLRNAPADTEDGRVGALLVVEDSVPFYSAYLPLLYGEMMTQTQRLIAEEMNDADKYWRMRTRPKVLLARNWEEAVILGETYREALIGVVTDVAFLRDGRIDERAGIALIERFRSFGVSVPVLFQSSDESLSAEVVNAGARFQGKLSGDLHRGIRRFILEELGFGDFVFRSPEGREVRRIRTLREFALAIESIPTPLLLHHAGRNDYSRWMAAHGEYRVARKTKSVQVEDFENSEDHREFLIRSFRELRESRHRGRLVEFSFSDPGAPGSVSRYGSGSLGGKGRGLAFFNALLHAIPWEKEFAPLRVLIPKALIIATGEFDAFLEKQKLPPSKVVDDAALRRAFLSAPLSEKLTKVLRAFVEREDGPLAIRSSALLEDSQSVPLAGVYDTYMLPGGSSPDRRLQMLTDAVRLVWASTYSTDATVSRNAMGIGGEEEKMAVVIQRVAGRSHGNYWFPQLSGTALSLNYYPIKRLDREDGVARIAVGLGRTVVEGDRGFLFCPRHPAIPWSSDEDRWKEGQTEFWAIKNPESEKETADLLAGESATLERLEIRAAEQMDALRHMASTWNVEEHRLADGLDIPGPRVVDFRDILNYDWLPLAPLLDQLLHLSRSAMGIPVELEFALDWEGHSPRNAVFSLLQVRPLVSQTGTAAIIPEGPSNGNLVLRSEKSLGHGVIPGIRDLVWVDPEAYDSTNTESLRKDVVAIMEELADAGREAILMGPGRWGSQDRFLGIPVTWSQVRQAKLIVELIRKAGDPEPSQGSHFFHNIVSLGVGYAHISMKGSGGLINWDFLRRHSHDAGPVHHAVCERPMSIAMDGKKGIACVYVDEIVK